MGPRIEGFEAALASRVDRKYGIAVNSAFVANDSPFGGWVTIAGHILNIRQL